MTIQRMYRSLNESPVTAVARSFLFSLYKAAILRRRFNQCIDELRVGAIIDGLDTSAPTLNVELNRAQMLLAPRRIKRPDFVKPVTNVLVTAEQFANAADAGAGAGIVKSENLIRELRYFGLDSSRDKGKVTFDDAETQTMDSLVAVAERKTKTKGVQTSDEVLSLPPGPDYSKLALLQHGYLFLLRQQSNPLDFACCGVLSKLLKQESALTGHPQIEVEHTHDLSRNLCSP